MFSTKEKQALFAELVKAYPALSASKLASVADDLFTYSRRIHRLQMIETNDRELRPFEQKTFEDAEQAAHKLAAEIGFKVEIPDVRSGAGLTVYLPTRAYNNMGGESWNVVVRK